MIIEDRDDEPKSHGSHNDLTPTGEPNSIGAPEPTPDAPSFPTPQTPNNVEFVAPDLPGDAEDVPHVSQKVPGSRPTGIVHGVSLIEDPRRCTATNRAGERCKRSAILGGHVCHLHGGAAQQVIDAAKRRLLAGADRAIDHLLKLLEPREPCAACGRGDHDRDPTIVRAAQIVLDRAGLGPSGSLVVSTNETRIDLSAMTVDDLVERAEDILRQGRELIALEARVASLDGEFLVPESDPLDDAEVQS